jgi:hypothetical protein
MTFRRPRTAPAQPLPSLLQHELNVAKQLLVHGEEESLVTAVETCIKHSGNGPFTPREVELLRAAAKAST